MMLDFTFPADCLAAVGEVFSGQYALPSACSPTGTPRVLDIGANCGAFTFWARLTWPGCSVIAYEPQPEIFAYLKSNLANIPNATAVNSAIGDPAKPFLFLGRYSRLCSAQEDQGDQTSEQIPVTVIAPAELPEADILKIDAEGAEGYIIERLPFVPAAIMLEWHGAENRRRVELALADKMILSSTRMLSCTTGLCCYIRP